MRPLAVALLLLGCSRPTAPAPQRHGVELSDVRLTTWRGPELTARGTAQRATLTAAGFAADGVELTTASGTTVRAPRVDGELDLSRITADRLDVETASGCVGSTQGRVVYQGAFVTSSGPVCAQGCGFSLSGSKLTYSVLERRAVVEGPVHTLLEARP